MLRNLPGLKLTEQCEKLILQGFSDKSGNFNYNEFFTHLRTIELLKAVDCTISLFGVNYAMLVGIMKAFDLFDKHLEKNICEKLGDAYCDRSFTRFCSYLTQLPRELGITYYDAAYMYQDALKYNGNMEMREEDMAKAVTRFVKEKGSLDVQTECFNQMIFIKKQERGPRRKNTIIVEQSPKNGQYPGTGKKSGKNSGSKESTKGKGPSSFGDAMRKASQSPRNRGSSKNMPDLKLGSRNRGPSNFAEAAGLDSASIKNSARGSDSKGNNTKLFRKESSKANLYK